MPDQYICIRKCYLHERLWELGDIFDPPFEGAKPNKHFAINGVTNPENKIGPMGHGDDPRPTKQIKADLEALTGKPASKSMNRKALFWAWMEASKENHIPFPKPVDEEPVIKSPQDHQGKQILFSNMTPDQIDQIGVPEIRERLEAEPYSLQLGSGYLKKDELIKRAIAVEDGMKINAISAAQQ